MNGFPQKASTPLTVLVVEDDPGMARLILRLVEAEGFTGVHAPSMAAAMDAATQTVFNLLVLDNHLPDGSGIQLFHKIRAKGSQALAIMLTGFPDLAEAVDLTRSGLYDYLAKPFELDVLRACLRNAGERLRQPASGVGLGDFVGVSPCMQDVRRMLEQAANHPAATVLLRGETGVGKELAARVIHSLANNLGDGESPMVSLDCSAIPSELFEAELYGAEKGAYTGSHERRQGLVGAASRGTLFLDEIGEVPLLLQAKLLRFLESREYRRLGSDVIRQFKGRIITATNRDLEEEVRAGRFRADLLYRLDVLTIEIPPLRARNGDLPQIAEALLSQISKKYLRAKPHMRAEDLKLIRDYPFPGNVRELRNLLERSLLYTPTDSAWLHLDASWLRRLSPATSAAAEPAAVPKPATAGPATKLGCPPGLTVIEAQEFELLAKTLKEERGNISAVARKTGLSRQALHRRFEKWPELRAHGGVR